MFVAIALFPKVPTERDAQFLEWFSWSNDQLREVEGLQGRRLLRTAEGTYAALVEHSSAQTFAAMHTTAVISQVQAHLAEVLAEAPQATSYEVIQDLAKSGSCCGGAGGHGKQSGHELSVVGVRTEAPVAGSCCRGA